MRWIAFAVVAALWFGCARSGGRSGGELPDMAGGCTVGTPPACDGDTLIRCRADGSGLDRTPCPFGCGGGQCLCQPGGVVCSGQDVVKCGIDGLGHVDHTCAQGTVCTGGACDDLRCTDETMQSGEFGLPVHAWPRFRHDNRNSGWTPAVVAAQPKLKWKVFVGGNPGAGPQLGSGPIVSPSNTIFITGGMSDAHGGSLHSLDASGKESYFFAAQIPYDLSTPAVRKDGTTYFSGQLLYAVDALGMQQWSYPLPVAADSDPVVTKDGLVIYGCDDASLYALSPMGKLIWKTDPASGPGEVDGGVAESCDGRLVVGGANGWFSIDAATGNKLWSVPTAGGFGATQSSPVLAADGTMYGFDSMGVGYAIDPAGQILWKKPVSPHGGGGAQAARIGPLIFSVLQDGQLYAVDAASGAPVWSKPAGIELSFAIAGPIVDGNQRLYVNGSDGFVHAFDTLGTELWKLPSSGVAGGSTLIATPAIGDDGTLYVPGPDGYLYAYQ